MIPSHGNLLLPDEPIWIRLKPANFHVLKGRNASRRVLKLMARDVDDRKLCIDSPKSGRQSEVVFIPKKVAERLKDYIRSKEMRSADRIFQMGYTGARAIVKKPGRAVGSDLCAHDLRCTCAFRLARHLRSRKDSIG